ncbi:unnamed protein product [Durusdinium trenchii]|uniref:amino-acid N-acetyltransferase n=1 Tax=Durusdinium trenchii TaxID=1381693 RepID=A0ABP0S6P1_9DINO
MSYLAQPLQWKCAQSCSSKCYCCSGHTGLQRPKAESPLLGPYVRGLPAILALSGASQWRRKYNRSRCVARAQTELVEKEIRAAMQLDPTRLEIQSSKDSNDNRDLRGEWLPLFRGSAPYVAMFRQSIMVFHIPGRLLMETQSSELEGLLGDIALCAVLGVRPVLVPSLSQRVWARLSAECKEFEVKEDPDALEALCNASFESAEMVARLLKQEAGMLCAEVQDLFLRVAAKPTGNFETNKSLSVFASSQLVSAAPQRAASGWQSSPLLGRVTGIDSAQILQRLQEEQVVCVLPVAAGPLRGDGRLHYIPSEELAAQVAEQLKAAKLIFFTRGQRIVDTAHGNAIPTMQLGEASRLLEHAKTSSTFMDKDESKEVVKYLQWLIQALRSGTRRGHLIDPQRGALLQELYTTDGSGTMISLDLYDGIRMAGSGDVSGILDLIEPLVKRGLLKRRGTYEVERACNNQEMFVWKRDDKFVGCASLERFEDAPGKAELGCFVVSPLCRGKGHGAVLLSYIERVATLLGVRQLFLLTTQTMQAQLR